MESIGATPARAGRFVYAVLLLSLVVKAGVFFTLYARGPDRVVGQDTPSYEGPARALVQTGRFAVHPSQPDVPATMVPPGYPLFIAAIYRAAGERRDVVVGAQILVSVLTVWLTFAVGARLWGHAAGRLAALLLAVDLLSFTYAGILFADTLFTALLMAACCAAVEHLLTARARWAAGFAIALAAATLVRPISYYLFWPLCAGMLIRHWRAGMSLKRVTAIGVVMALPWLLLIGGWRARNERTIGRAQLSDIQAVNLFLFRAAGIVAVRDGISFFDAQRRLAESLPDVSGMTRGEIDAVYEREAIRIFAAHPWLLIRTEAFGLIKVLAGTGRADFLHVYGGQPYELMPAGAVGLSAADARDKFAADRWVLFTVGYVLVHLAVLYASGVYGASVGWVRRRPRAPQVLLAATGAYLVLVAAGPEAYARFRVPVMPVSALFAGLGLASWRGQLAAVPD